MLKPDVFNADRQDSTHTSPDMSNAELTSAAMNLYVQVSMLAKMYPETDIM